MNPHEEYDVLLLQFMLKLRDAYAASPIAERATLAELNDIIAQFEDIMARQRQEVAR